MGAVSRHRAWSQWPEFQRPQREALELKCDRLCFVLVTCPGFIRLF